MASTNNARGALWASGHDESVEVNQRALIDKVLARYSGEFTVFRELLQNSDDAQSKSVEIHFETQDFINRRDAIHVGGEQRERPLPDLKTAIVHQWTFKNNGIVFREEDWNRLRKIAEGNPDEEKIGAFGVGFYSLFSVTEEPFVTSGDKWMGFYWKDGKDQLYARRGQLPSNNDALETNWTSFEMLLREPGPIPVAFDFTRFIASSITFMAYLSEVTVFFDDKRLARLTKASGVPVELGIPKGLKNSSRSGIMTVKNIKSTPLHITAEIMQWVFTSGTEKARPTPLLKPNKTAGNGGFFSSLFTTIAGAATTQRPAIPMPTTPAAVTDHLTINETSVVLSIFSADVDVRLDKKLAAELHRSTKKNPPSRLKYELIYTGKGEYDASKREEEKQLFATGSVFQGLRADLDGAGSARVFIGHATAQTTGLGGHMATRFIPTVERESIDLMDRHVAIWNKELLYIGGILARSAYELELANIKDLWDGSSHTVPPLSGPDREIQTWLRNRSLHALKFFTFHQSTPSADVAHLLEDSFFSCAMDNNFSLMSTVGVRSTAEVRLPDATFSGFLKRLPVLPDDIFNGAPNMVASLQAREMIKAITFEDVLKELRERPLIEEEMIACLTWWKGITSQDDSAKFSHIGVQLLDAAILTIGKPGGVDERIIPLNTVRTFVNPHGIIPLDGPLPDHLIPVGISKNLPSGWMSSSFQWKELTITAWLDHICSAAVRANAEHGITVSAPWAERVLGVLTRAWPSLPASSKEQTISRLKNENCIPTSSGMKAPEQAYFANADIFHDLPVVTFPSGVTVKGTLERVLEALGVRKHVDLQVVFNRMIKTNEWTVAELIKYLASVQSTLTTEEWARLKMTAAFAKETVSPTGTDALKPTRYRAGQLYEPIEVLRQLGLPVIDWGKQTKWRGMSNDAKFLFELGLLRYPPLDVLIKLCASQDANIRTLALKYLLDNINSRYKDYEASDFGDVAFIPALRGTDSCLGTPKEVYSTSDWAKLGFLVTHPSVPQDAPAKLKLRQHPPTSALVTLLERTPPKDETEAAIWFSVLAGRIHDFSNPELGRLAQLPMVPTRKDTGEGSKLDIRWLPPSQCFFARDSEGNFHSKLFVFVNFGTPANGFLSACGTKHEPNVEDVAQMLLKDPHGFYRLAENPNIFLDELRNIAVNSRLIPPGTISRMKRAPILLGSMRKLRVSGKKGSDIEDGDDDEWELQYDLRRPDQIVIADDTHAHQAFGHSLFTAPQEDILEAFYAQLGSRRLSSLVKEEYQTTSEIKDSKLALEIRSLILERLPLFLHEHTHARTRVSYSWLTSNKNFIVKTFGKLSVQKTLTFEELNLPWKQDASAVATRPNHGPIQLWLGNNAQVDMYEVATSLNRLLFDAPKANDALLFMTILSTDLKALKRRGYNVDRILRQQKAERQAVEDARKQAVNDVKRAESVALVSSPSPNPNDKPAPLASATTGINPEPESSSERLIPGSNLLQSLKRRFNPLDRSQTSSPTPEAGQGSSGPLINRPGTPSAANVQRPISQPIPNQTVTPLSNIASNIDMAIKACRPESGNLLRNREEMRQVKESLNEGYCDVSGRTGDLNYAGEMGNVKIYLSQEVPQPRSFVATKREAMARFIHIMTSLTQAYQLPLTNLHIFYDLAGGLIAFNRNGSIFLNLRYYEAWHDDDVLKGTLNPAYISWYFTLAHEIAHNLVQPHNSEHEFYFSAICEKHIMALGKLLAPP